RCVTTRNAEFGADYGKRWRFGINPEKSAVQEDLTLPLGDRVETVEATRQTDKARSEKIQTLQYRRLSFDYSHQSQFLPLSVSIEGGLKEDICLCGGSYRPLPPEVLQSESNNYW